MPYQDSPEDPQEWEYAPIRSQRRTIRQILIVDLPLIALIGYFTVVVFFLDPRLVLLLGSGNHEPFFFRLIILVRFLLPIAVLITSIFYLLGVGRNFLIKLFHPSSSKQEVGIRVWNRLWGWHQRLLPKFIIINSTRLDPPDHWSKWLGGPAYLVVYDGFAAYLEYGNRFNAVVGAQVPIRELDPRETIKAIVDLRPQFRNFEVNGWTKDGIKVILGVRVESRIGSNYSPEKDDPRLLYPFDSPSVQRAVEYTAVREHEGKLVEVDWCERVTGRIRGLLAHHITSRRLDELFLTDRGDKQVLSADVLRQLLEEVNNGLRDAGIHVSNIQITGTQIPEDVYGQRLDVWKSGKDSTVTRIRGEAHAYEIRVGEEARARAQRELILSITRSLAGINPGQYAEATLLSLSKVLDQGLKDPLVRTFMARDTIALLEELL